MSTARAGGRGNKEKLSKTQNSTTQNTRQDPQSAPTKNQPTAEQLRLAKMLTESEDAELQKKLKQLIELTGRSIDEAMVALHDCNYDLNRAVDKLLEDENNEGEWQEAGSKKKKNQPSSNKTNAAEPTGNAVNHKTDKRHDKNKDREEDSAAAQDNDRGDRGGFGAPRGRRNDRAPPRFQRGRGRESNDGDRNDSRSRDRPSGERGRGRARGSASGGRGRGRGAGSMASGSRGGFGNREKGFEKGPQIDTWTNETAEKETDGNIGAWTEDWSADEWTGPLDEPKVFTSSSAPSEPKMFSPPASLPNDNDAKVFDSQVFTASSIANASVTTTYEDNSAFGISGLGQDSLNSLSQNSITQNALNQASMGQNSLRQSSLGQRLELGMLLPKTASASSNESAHTNQPSASSYLSQYAKEASENIKNAVGAGSATGGSTSQQQYLSQYNKEATESIKNAVGIGSSPSTNSSNQQQQQQQQQSMVNPHSVSSAVTQSMMSNTPPPGLSNTPGGGGAQRASPAANKQAARSKQPPPSKIPASAVVMPGGMNYRLDVQFGTLDFNGSQDPSNSVGFSVGGGSSTDTGFNTTTSSSQSGLNNHQDHSSLGSRGGSGLESMSQTQPVTRGTVTGGVYQPNNTTPPKDYASQNSLSAAQQPSKISSPDSMAYPQSERKSSPFSTQRSTSLTGGLSSNKTSISSPQMSYGGQPSAGAYNSYQTSYKSPPQQSQNLVSASSSFSSSASTGSMSSQQYSSSTYQAASFQSAAAVPSSYGVPSQSTSAGVYSQGTGYQGQSNSSYQSQSAYGGVSQSAGAGTSASYHNRDSNGGTQSSFSNNASQSVSGSSPAPSYVGRVTGTGDNTSSSSVSAPGSGYGSSSGSSGNQYSVTSLQSGSIGASKLTDSLSKMAVKESGLEASSAGSSNHYGMDGGSVPTSSTNSNMGSLSGSHAGVSSALGLAGANAPTTSTTKASGSTKPPPNLPPGVPLVPQNYMIGQPAMPFAFGLTQPAIPQYTYEELQLLTQQRPLLPGYYDMPLQPATTLAAAAAGGPAGSALASTGRADQANLINAAAAASVPYSASDSGSKLGRMDAQSPVNVSSQPGSSGSLGGSGSTQSAHQAFINPAAGIPPSYNYYYPLPGYSYTNLIQVPSVSNATHGGTTGSSPFQKQGYASHAYGSAGQSQDFSKTYGGATQAQSKGSVMAGGPSVTTSTVADITSPGYGAKTHSQSYDKGFHGATGTPPPFNLMPSAAATQGGTALGQPAYAAAPYGIPMVAPTHQPHSQMLHHPLQPDATGGSSRGSQQGNSAPKGVGGTKAYSTGYWNN